MKYRCFIFVVFFINSVLAQQQFSVFFESDKYELTKKEQQKFNQWMLANQSSKVVAIHGFTDIDGTKGYNDTLAKKRVDVIYDLIKDEIKIREDFKTISVGENFKHSENKAESRKVTIYYIEQKDIAREDEILGIKKEESKKDEPRPDIDFPDKMVYEAPDGSKKEYKMDPVFMKKLDKAKPGDKLKIENLNFIINTYAVVPESRAKLYELLFVLQNNSSLKIEIQGHLCCMPVDRLDLSTQRAKAVYNFLISNQIYPGRLSYKGFGSSQPVFPLPEKDEAQRATNRRVEILVIEN
jgi:outer membrane protein OmpA-like peptidoglycan-associated protein